MKITGFETIPIQGRAMILKMFTDEGIIGYGEPMNYEHWARRCASRGRHGGIPYRQRPAAD